MRRVLSHERRGLDGRMTDELGAEELQVPGPIVPGIGSGMDAEESSTAAYVGLQRVLPGLVEHLASCVQEHDRLDASQSVRREGSWVLGREHGKTFGRGTIAHRRERCGNRVVAEPKGTRAQPQVR